VHSRPSAAGISDCNQHAIVNDHTHVNPCLVIIDANAFAALDAHTRAIGHPDTSDGAFSGEGGGRD
jgi:hypothetical protein